MDSFDQVTARADRVLLVASGKSAEEIDIRMLQKARSRGVHVIGVNRVWDWLKELDSWFTLDPDRLLMKFMFEYDTTVQRYVAVPDDYGQPNARVRYHRMPRVKEIIYLRRLAGDGEFSAREGLSADPSVIHTGNSGYGGLGLARHMQPQRIAMVGVDAFRQWGYANMPGRPKMTLHHLPALFESAVPDLNMAGIEVVNGSQRSLVECFPKMPINDAIWWLMDGI